MKCTSLPLLGWMAPLRHLGAKVLVGENQSADKVSGQGAIHERDYDGRLRFGEECVPGAWGRCRGDDGSAQAASTGTSASILQSSCVDCSQCFATGNWADGFFAFTNGSMVLDNCGSFGNNWAGIGGRAALANQSVLNLSIDDERHLWRRRRWGQLRWAGQWFNHVGQRRARRLRLRPWRVREQRGLGCSNFTSAQHRWQ